MGHHHQHGGGHHHHHPHPVLGRVAGQPPLSWVAVCFAVLLFTYGAVDGWITYRVYAHGQRGMGVVTRVYDGTTILEVDGSVCAIDDEVGRVGGMVPVAYPLGRPINCIVRRVDTFRWPGGALLAGGGLLVGLWFWRRSALGTPNTGPS